MSINFDHTCPITQSHMINPVKLGPCGHIFEERAIQQWRSKSNTCPLDRRKIEQLELQEGLQKEIHTFIGNNPEMFENKTVQDLEKELTTTHASIEDPRNLFLRDRVDAGPIFVRIVDHQTPMERIRMREYSGPRVEAYFREVHDTQVYAFALSNDGEHFYMNHDRPRSAEHPNRNLIMAAAIAVTAISLGLFIYYKTSPND